MPPSSLTQQTEFLVDKGLYTTTQRIFFLYAANTYFSVAMWFILSYSLNGEWQLSLAGISGNHLKGGQERAGK